MLKYNYIEYLNILGLFKHISHQNLVFLRKLPLKIHNFNIFVDKLYLKTDCNVWFAVFWPLQTKFVLEPWAHFTGRMVCFKLLENCT